MIKIDRLKINLDYFNNNCTHFLNKQVGFCGYKHKTKQGPYVSW